MAIISFWNEGKEETGKSSALVSIATYLGINHNYKVLVIDTKSNDYFYQDCFWRENKGTNEITENIYSGMEDGIKGLSRAVLSNKISPEIITNYTKVVFNDNRLEILMDKNSAKEEYEMHKTMFKDIIKMANRYYDLVLVDLDNRLDDNTTDLLLEISDLIIGCIPQKVRSINEYVKARRSKTVLQEKTIMTLIGRYDPDSKFSSKVISKFIKEKGESSIIPYNTDFVEACNEGKVSNMFEKYIKVNKKDKNAFFINSVQEATQKIIYKLQELQMRT